VVERDGKRLISFSCNDYLNLSQHPLVRAAAAEAALNYGAGAAASECEGRRMMRMRSSRERRAAR
jgi:7-keto-8-aminopelargonate synthetase-like enzyme